MKDRINRGDNQTGGGRAMKKPTIQADPNMDPLQYQIGFTAGADAMYNALRDGGGLQAWVDGAPKSSGIHLLIDVGGLYFAGRHDASAGGVWGADGFWSNEQIKRHMRINTDAA